MIWPSIVQLIIKTFLKILTIGALKKQNICVMENFHQEGDPQKENVVCLSGSAIKFTNLSQEDLISNTGMSFNDNE